MGNTLSSRVNRVVSEKANTKHFNIVRLRGVQDVSVHRINDGFYRMFRVEILQRLKRNNQTFFSVKFSLSVHGFGHAIGVKKYAVARIQTQG